MISKPSSCGYLLREKDDSVKQGAFVINGWESLCFRPDGTNTITVLVGARQEPKSVLVAKSDFWDKEWKTATYVNYKFLNNMLKLNFEPPSGFVATGNILGNLNLTITF